MEMDENVVVMIVFVTGWRHDAQISGDSLCVIFVKLSVILLPQSSPIFSSLRSINTPLNNQEILTNWEKKIWECVNVGEYMVAAMLYNNEKYSNTSASKDLLLFQMK